MDYAVKNWWLSLLVGLLYIIVAIYLMFAPLASYVALSILFSVSMFVSGLFEIAFALANKKGISSWGWYLAGGIIDLILGIFLMASPGLSMEVLPFVLAFCIDFICTHPPYADIIKYSEGIEGDISMLGAKPFIDAPAAILFLPAKYSALTDANDAAVCPDGKE